MRTALLLILGSATAQAILLACGAGDLRTAITGFLYFAGGAILTALLSD